MTIKKEQRIVLEKIAFARSGDKGSSANIAVFARSRKDYPFLLKFLSAQRVKSYFKALGVKKVDRYEVPNLEAINFVLHDILAGGGSRSLRMDSQGKTLGQAMLQMPLPSRSKPL
jgi:hypothetical protein